MSEGRELPKVSVVIPAYNHGQFLGEAIQSVLDQTFQDWELIVVDDGSTDNTREVVASFKDPRIRYIYQENRGAAGALNTGIRHACGEYIGLLGADDAWFPEKLSLQVAQLDSLPPKVGLVYSDLELFNQERSRVTGLFLQGRQPPRGNVFKALMRHDGWFIGPASALIRREVFQKVGLFDEELRTHEDWELWVRIAREYEVEALDRPLVRRRWHKTNLSGNVEKMYVNGQKARLKVLQTIPLKADERRALRHALARQHYGYGTVQASLGRQKEARAAFRSAIRFHSTYAAAYLWLMLTYVSPRLFTLLRSLKRKVLPSRRFS